MTVYRASWVVPVSGPPIADGAVAVRGDRIELVGPWSEVRSKLTVDRETVDLGRAALIPGLVNTHTHLELTALRGLVEDCPFAGWLRELVRLKYRVLRPDDYRLSALWGALECLRAGITCIGDTGDSGATIEAMRTTGLKGIVYQEVFGPDPGEAESAVKTLSRKTRDLAAKAGGDIRIGVSPHALYTVSDRLFQLTARLAAQEGLDMAIHVSESEDETSLTRDGTGLFAGGLASRGIPITPRHLTPIRTLESLGILEQSPLLIHATQASNEDLLLIRSRGARVAHCPRSNAKLGHGIAPLHAMLSGGLSVGLGSDSVVSNNVIDLLGEARAAALMARARERRADVLAASQALELATLGGARTLRLENLLGTIEVGKKADLTAVSFGDISALPVVDPVSSLIFSANARDVIMTIVNGTVVHDHGHFPTLESTKPDEIKTHLLELGDRLRDALLVKTHSKRER